VVGGVLAVADGDENSGGVDDEGSRQEADVAGGFALAEALPEGFEAAPEHGEV
jgi:hypothetical protein